MSGALGQWFKEKINRDMSVVSTDGGEMLNPQQELARKNKELADKTALENEVRRGELIETDVVEAAWTDILARVRARMLRLPSAVAPLVLGEDDQIVIQETIEDMVRDALSEMSADWREDPITELPE
jgi:terminase small subunit / prophage DNA-packing protein